MKKKKILKALSIVLCTFLLFSMAGCGNSEKKSSNPNFSVDLTEEGLLDGIDPSDYVKVADYSSVVIPKSETEVSDEDVQSEIDSVLSDHTEKSQIKDRAVQDGDTVNIDYVGRIDGVEFENGSTNGKGTDVTIGETQYIDDFLEQLIGHTPGETFDVNVTFPDDYGDEAVNGKDAVFETTINYISEEKQPELTDEFVAETLQKDYDATTVDEFRASVRTDLENSKKEKYMWTYILDNSEFSSLPEDLVQDQIDLRYEVTQAQMKNYGYSMDQVLSSQGFEDVDALKESFRSDCEKLVKEYLAFQVIFEDQKLEVKDDDVKEFFGKDDISQYVDYYGKGYVNRLALNSKVLQYLVGKATVEDVPVSDSGTDQTAADGETADVSESAGTDGSMTDVNADIGADIGVGDEETPQE